MTRRASGSLSPRLIEFKRRESLDSFESHEKSHEQETNELQTLNTKVEELIGTFVFYALCSISYARSK